MDAIFSRLSPGGRGAIAVAGIWGAGAVAILERHFRTPSGRGRVGESPAALYGELLDGEGEVVDDGMILPVPGRGVPAFLITLHGNPALLGRLCEVFAAAGAEEAPPEVSFWLGEVGESAIGREALDLLPRARTAGGATFLLEQRRGGLAPWARSARSQAPPLAELREVLGRAPIGRGLFEPRLVVLSGIPNAGKSTLFNRLLRTERVVTHPDAGTTRDLIEEIVPIGDFPIRLVDGAGLRESRDDIEREGVRRMRRAHRDADLIVHLVPPGEIGKDRTLSASATAREKGAVLRIRSRADESPDDDPAELLRVSAVTGEGVRDLEMKILTRLFGVTEIPRVLPVPFLARHQTILERARELAERGHDPRPVLEDLCTGTGTGEPAPGLFG